MSARRSIAMALVWLCGVAGGQLLWSAPAGAQRLHVFSSSFGSEGTGPGQFMGPGPVAVNDTTGDVYVTDQGNERVEVFSATGSFISEFDGSESPTGKFLWPRDGGGSARGASGQIAVDNSGSLSDPSAGDVYVIDPGHYVVDKFNAGGSYIGQVPLPAPKTIGAFPQPKGVAVDASGTLFVEMGVDEITGTPYPPDSEAPLVAEFNDASANQLVREIFPTLLQKNPNGSISAGVGAGVIGMAVDREGNIYEGYCPNWVYCSPYSGFKEDTEEERVQFQNIVKYGSNGGMLSKDFDSEDSTGLALDQSSGDVYLDNATSIAAFTTSGQPIERFGSGDLGEGTVTLSGEPHGPERTGTVAVASEGIAVNSATGAVYASDAATQQVSVFSAFVVPDVSTGSASGYGETSATVGGVVNPDGLPVTSCVFEYGTTGSYGQEAPCAQSPGAIGSGSAPVSVSASLTGLEHLTSYHFRLRVSNVNGSNAGQDRLFATPEPVAISEEAASDVSSGGAAFSAVVDPENSETKFRFEYGPSASYGESLPAGGGLLGAGASGVPVSVRSENLTPGTVYHMRLVASNVLGVVYGPDETFVTPTVAGTSGLLDGRIWEMVSPQHKYGAAIEPLAYAVIEAAENGGAFTYMTSSSIEPNPAGNSAPTTPLQALSRRGAGGWSTEEIALPRPGVVGNYGYTSEYRLFTGDLSTALVEPLSQGQFDPLSPEATEPTPYLRENQTGIDVPLVTASSVSPVGTKFSGPEEKYEDLRAVAATPDLAHVLLYSSLPLTQNATLAKSDMVNVYEWAGGRLKLVSVLPSGTAAGGGVIGDLGGYSSGNNSRDVRHVISNDGSKVFWKELEYLGENSPLYMRDTATEQTVQVDAPAPGVPAPPAFKPRFQLASANGSLVFFNEEEPLTADSKVAPVSAGFFGPSSDLYVYDTETGVLTDLTGGGGASGSEPGGAVGEVLGASEDGSVVYFVAGAALAAGAQPGLNLYVARNTGSGWSKRLIAPLSGADMQGLVGARDSEHPGEGGQLTARVSPNGRFVAFMSDRSLTGYDNRDLVSGVPDEEVFLYDEQSNRLVCASCNPTGERPAGLFDEAPLGHGSGPLFDVPEWWVGQWLAAMIPGYRGEEGRRGGFPDARDPFGYQQRYLSDEGRLFFDGFDPLSSQATNGKTNVYEYEPDQVGGCQQSQGCVGLVSSGTSSEESIFMDASSSGNDVFFLTSSRLVSQDVDTSMDVYDAHSCSSASPCVTSVVAPPPCASGDACKAAPSPQPAIFGAPASATFSGKGNVVSSPPPVMKPKRSKKRTVMCQKARRHRSGRCVKSRTSRLRFRAAGRGPGKPVARRGGAS